MHSYIMIGVGANYHCAKMASGRYLCIDIMLLDISENKLRELIIARA